MQRILWAEFKKFWQLLQQHNGHLVPLFFFFINSNILPQIIVQLVFLHPSKALIA